MRLRDGTVYHRLIWIGDFFSLWFCYSCCSMIFSSSVHFTFSQPVSLHSSLLSSSFSGMQLAALWKISHQYSVCICYCHPSYVHIQPSIVWQYQPFSIIIIIIIAVIIGSTALGGPWPPQAHVASHLYPGHLPANFQNPVSLHLPQTCQSILISVGHVLVDVQGFVHIIFLGNSFSSIRTTWPAHLSLLVFITLTIFGSL